MYNKKHEEIRDKTSGGITHNIRPVSPGFRRCKFMGEMMDLKTRLCEIDNGRFEEIIDALDVKDVCEKCDFFNLSIKDPMKGYRCHCLGHCIDATLSFRLVSYLNWKLGWITDKDHLNNCGFVEE